ncbi:MAG: ATP phosphoribosyltransferase regulatory subunit [Gammaproteobacteria bacterium]|nr:ATP phosphoribosyltransferase regulatory subunit [Gammaproteobacteria bacterium]
MNQKANYWLLPDGINEVLPEKAKQLEMLRRQLLDVFQSWGYELVMPPMIEYLESLLTGTGHDLDLKTFKLIDQLNGKTMGVRADMTPQVARIDAHSLRREEPTRLCYIGTVLHTRSEGLASSRSPMQVGAELFGHAGINSDIEVINLMIETLSSAGIKGLHVDLGHVGIYRSLISRSSISEAEETTLFDMLQRKSLPEIKTYFANLDIEPEMAASLTALAQLNGDLSVIDTARDILGNEDETINNALNDIECIANVISQQNTDITINIDLSELRGYHYQTGMVFAAYVPGHGQELARGGRYDEIGKVFGRARPATGFSTDLKVLAKLAVSTEAVTMSKILAPSINDESLQRVVRELRAAGDIVIASLDESVTNAKQMGCDRVLQQQDKNWIVINR